MGYKLLRQRKQSKTIIQSRNVLDLCFMMKMIIGTFVASISPHVTNCASRNNSNIESSPRLRNSCSNVSTIRSSVLLRIVNFTSSMSGEECWTGTPLRRGLYICREPSWVTGVCQEKQLDLAFNNVKPKDWYFVLDLVWVRTELGCVRLTNQKWLNGSRTSFLVPSNSPSKS